ncbi:hypothetical protein HO133_009285 [Letharia lupina]|uniref:Uncharacterized protein n=1 Tax=Letharia lupina TaxID=560253 RepID=A0A8H6CND5_9LECA|nr:uncharacterized protein HO133_009285 [Letharia lupina]KAF6226419.1 hypothetical protein HO133_009285 [Letharia lupina]
MSEPSTTNVEALKENETVTNEGGKDTTGSKIPKRWTGTVIDVDHEEWDDWRDQWQTLIVSAAFENATKTWAKAPQGGWLNDRKVYLILKDEEPSKKTGGPRSSRRNLELRWGVKAKAPWHPDTPRIDDTRFVCLDAPISDDAAS